MINKRKTGEKQECLAEDYLRHQGYLILERNFRCRQGEIDLIGRQGKYLCFIEVKYRSSEKHGMPEESVNIKKQMRISKAAAYYVNKNKLSFEEPYRFDVVSILGEKIKLITNAFEYYGAC